MKTKKKPRCRIAGTDGNALAVINSVVEALKKSGDDAGAFRFCAAAFASPSYDALLRLATDYCEVKGSLEKEL